MVKFDEGRVCDRLLDQYFKPDNIELDNQLPGKLNPN